jgi:uncharacterized membrane protein
LRAIVDERRWPVYSCELMGSKTKRVLLALAAVFYVVAGVFHFVETDGYLKIMPPWIPSHVAMVYISGAAEIAGGIGLLIPGLRRAAAWGLVALLIAVFPANVYMAMNNVQVTSRPIPAVLLWARLPFQGLLIWWVLRAAARSSALTPGD